MVIFLGSSLAQDALNISDFNLSRSRSSMTFSSLSRSSPGFSSTSNFKGLAVSRGRHNLFAFSGSSLTSLLTSSSNKQSVSAEMFRLLNLSSGSALSEVSDISCLLPTSGSSLWTSGSSVNSDVPDSYSNAVQLSQHSQHTLFTLYEYPVPGSITSSNPYQDQLKRSEREYIFVQRPFASPLPLVDRWLKDHFSVGSQTSRGNKSSENAKLEFDQGGQSEPRLQESHRSYYSSEFGEPSNLNPADLSGQDAQASSCPWVAFRGQGDQAIQRDSCYLINNKRTDVILCGIPQPAIKMTPPKTSGSMIELRKPKWSSSCPSTSLPNIRKDFQVRNKSFEFHVKNLLIEGNGALQCNSMEEKDNFFDDNMDSISIIFEKVEKRDQALRDAARGTNMFLNYYFFFRTMWAGLPQLKENFL